MDQRKTLCAFTLIELLTVIAIIGILASILIPTVGRVREQANIATSKARLSQYMSAIESFKGEYNYYPFSDIAISEQLSLSSVANSREFYETLSARDISDNDKVFEGGNRRGIGFYSFSEVELSDGAGSSAEDTIVDAFDNNNIIIMIDHDGDGLLDVPDPSSPNSTIEIRAKLTAYVETANGNPGYYLYE